MLSIEEFKIKVEENLNSLKRDIKFWEDISMFLQERQNVNEVSEAINKMTVSNSNIGIVGQKINEALNAPKLVLPDYDVNAKFDEKVRYYLNKHQRAFCLKELRDFLISVEDEERAVALLGAQPSATLKTLLRRKVIIGAIFESNKRTGYYLFPKWRTDDGSDILPIHYPEAFADDSEEMRSANKILKWVTK